MFEILYDEDVILEGAYLNWEKSEDSAEQEGKGVALMQVVAYTDFLTLFTLKRNTSDSMSEIYFKVIGKNGCETHYKNKLIKKDFYKNFSSLCLFFCF